MLHFFNVNKLELLEKIRKKVVKGVLLISGGPAFVLMILFNILRILWLKR